MRAAIALSLVTVVGACGGRTGLGTGGAAADAAPDAKADGATDSGQDGAPPALTGPELALGAGHSCAIMPDRTVRCWGANGYAQLGDGTKQDRHNPVPIAGLQDVAQISGGYTHTCARDLSGRVYCWGENHVGQVGNGQSCPPNDYYCCVLSPSLVAGIDGISVAAGGIHSCAVASNHHVHCWGYNSYGGLGNGSTDDSNVPVEVTGVTNAVAVAAGWTHTCMQSSKGTAKCWGLNEVGELGNGAVVDGPTTTPQDVIGLTGVVQLSLGDFFSCALIKDGTVACWGMNARGQLGDGTTTDRSVPGPVVGLNDVAQISAHEDLACARRNSGDVWCWGLDNPIPKAVAGLSQATDMSSGQQHACARAGQTQVLCWGWNSNGQLGDGTTVDHAAPAPVVW